MWSSMLTRIMSSRFMACSSLAGRTWTGSRRAHRQRLPAPDGRGVGALGPFVVDLPIGEATQHLVECETSLQPRQCGAQAKVDAVAEREVPTDVTVDVEAVPVGVGALLPVGRAVEGDHDASLGHLLAVELDVTLDVAGLH